MIIRQIQTITDIFRSNFPCISLSFNFHTLIRNCPKVILFFNFYLWIWLALQHLGSNTSTSAETVIIILLACSFRYISVPSI
jgi:hypothetical protein